MRDLFLITVFFGLLPFALAMPEVGILTWYAVSYAVPHHLAYGFAYAFPFAQIIGLITLVGWLISREQKRLVITPTMALLLVFAVWVSVTTVFAVFPDFEKWRETIIKIAATFLAFQIMRTPKRLHWLAWVTAISIALYGVKGGLFAIATGGSAQLHGPPESPIEDNNDLALALVMVLPLLRYAQSSAPAAWLKAGFTGSIILTSLAVLASYSRGGLLAIGSVGFYFWLKSRRKILIGVLFTIAVAGVWSFMPEQWFERMQTIGEYNTDASAGGRFDAWRHALHVAAARPLIGGGFGTFSKAVFAEFSPGVNWRAAHSIYFECLGEQGIVGIALFLGIWLSAFREARRAARLARGREELRRMAELATMLQLSLVGYAIGGAFLSMTYFELFYGLALMSATVRCVVEDQRAAEVTEPPPIQPARRSQTRSGVNPAVGSRRAIT